MSKIKGLVGFVMITCLLWSMVSMADDHKERRKHHKSDHNHEELKDAATGPQNELYRSTCGACHMAYPPVLLNAASWSALIQGRSNHFGEDLGIDPQDAAKLEAYLTSGAAEKAHGEVARDIANCVRNQVIPRITEIRTIQKEHHKLSASVLSRASIGGLSNCIACHKRADLGVFDDDEVSIPH